MSEILDRAPRVWMNVTTTVNWKRPPVGIVRVEQELFRALSASLGDRLVPCVLSDRKFVPHSGPIGTIEGPSFVEDRAIVWPDPSYDFPQTTSLEPANLRPLAARRSVAVQLERKSELEIAFGDILISVGLDWDWESQGLDAVLHDLKTRKNVKVITCCYDLIPVLFPHYCVGDVAAKFREYFTNLTWASSGMLCISERSQADYRALATELGMPEIPTKVMLLGNRLPESGDEVSERIASICEGRFILFVSTIERRKNHEVLYKALRILAEQGRLDPDLKLIFVGMPGWGVADLLKDLELDPLLKDQIIQLSHTTDAELRRLYEACTFFVYPSFYEGWGLPVAEALAFGRFVIASDRGSIPEVGGGLVEYVDPWNPNAWAEAIDKYWNDPERLKERESRIQRDYHPIHWDQSAAAVLELVETVSADRVSEFKFEPGYALSTLAGVHFGARILATGQSGTLCHGPYVALPAGRVQVSIDIESLNDNAVPIEFKFACDQGARVMSRQRRQIRSGCRTLRFDIEVKRAVEDFEVVVECGEGAHISLDKLTISLDPMQPRRGKSAARPSVSRSNRDHTRDALEGESVLDGPVKAAT